MNHLVHDDAVRRRLPELLEMAAISQEIGASGRARREGEVRDGSRVFPVYSFCFGSDDPSAPAVAFIGGVHGLERIGTTVVLSYLKSFLDMTRWDVTTRHVLGRARIIFLPLVNPVGMFRRRRANGNGVDLMRNAPMDAEDKPNLPLVGGHRLSPLLPYFRGRAHEPVEAEARVLMDVVRRELFPSRFALALDLHSGFGIEDRLWFPYAGSRRPFERAAEVYALKERLDAVLPHHVYRLEPQSRQYVTHGDLWDYLHREHSAARAERVFLPLCLEMGSWLWVKKNPRQLFSLLGIFNPVLPHRVRRTLRRHAALMDFLTRATASVEGWWCAAQHRASCEEKAMTLWYGRGGRA